MAYPDSGAGTGRTVVISGGTDGMGRALALARLGRGDRVFAIGTNAEKGTRLLAEAGALGGRLEFVQADLSTVAGNRRVIDSLGSDAAVVDALVLCANRQAPRRMETADGFESTFALYYLSRYLLSHRLFPALSRSASPVIVNVAGVGTSRGTVHWEDLQLRGDRRSYRGVTAQLQAGRMNDLLGVAFAGRYGGRVPYVLYHPGFTRSGDLSTLRAPVRLAIKAAARIAGRPVDRSIAPIVDFIDAPPAVPLTAVDRDKHLPLEFPTLNSQAARRLDQLTRELLASRDQPAEREPGNTKPGS